MPNGNRPWDHHDWDHPPGWNPNGPPLPPQPDNDDWRKRNWLRSICQQMSADLMKVQNNIAAYAQIQFPTDEQLGNMASLAQQIRTLAGG